MSDANLFDDPHTFHYHDYFVVGGIRTCLVVSDYPMFLWISSNSCPLNLLLVRSHQAEITIVKRLIRGHNSMTRVRVEPRSFDQGRRKNDAFTYSATLPWKRRLYSAPFIHRTATNQFALVTLVAHSHEFCKRKWRKKLFCAANNKLQPHRSINYSCSQFPKIFQSQLR